METDRITTPTLTGAVDTPTLRTMRTILATVAVALVTLTLGLPGRAAESTITGTLVEIGCADVPFGEGTAACMLRCASRGEPIGIRTSDGTYTVTGDWSKNIGEDVSELMTKEVKATGKIDGMTIAVTTLAPAE